MISGLETAARILRASSFGNRLRQFGYKIEQGWLLSWDTSEEADSEVSVDVEFKQEMS